MLYFHVSIISLLFAVGAGLSPWQQMQCDIMQYSVVSFAFLLAPVTVNSVEQWQSEGSDSMSAQSNLHLKVICQAS